MGNPLKGEQTFEALGESWTLSTGFNTMCTVEDIFDQPFLRVARRIFPQLSAEDMADKAKIAEAAMSIRMGDLRAIMRASLAEKHPGITQAEVGKLIDDVGVKAATGLVAACVMGCMIEDGEAGDDASGDPPKPGNRRKKAEPTG